jgi:hypothetical protein
MWWAAPVYLRGIPLNPAKNRGVIHGQAAFGHDFFQISVAQRLAQVLTNAGENHLGPVVPPLEKIGHAVASVYVDFS